VVDELELARVGIRSRDPPQHAKTDLVAVVVVVNYGALRGGYAGFLVKSQCP